MQQGWNIYPKHNQGPTQEGVFLRDVRRQGHNEVRLYAL